MKKDLVDILCCPKCKTALNLTATKSEDNEIIEGVLTCTACHHDYSITRGIPNLLPPE